MHIPSVGPNGLTLWHQVFGSWPVSDLGASECSLRSAGCPLESYISFFMRPQGLANRLWLFCQSSGSAWPQVSMFNLCSRQILTMLARQVIRPQQGQLSPVGFLLEYISDGSHSSRA